MEEEKERKKNRGIIIGFIGEEKHILPPNNINKIIYMVGGLPHLDIILYDSTNLIKIRSSNIFLYIRIGSEEY